jgi:hypothetical protein
MPCLIAILTAFCGGLLGRAFSFLTAWHRLFAFIVPVTCIGFSEKNLEQRRIIVACVDFTAVGSEQ